MMYVYWLLEFETIGWLTGWSVKVHSTKFKFINIVTKTKGPQAKVLSTSNYPCV